MSSPKARYHGLLTLRVCLLFAVAFISGTNATGPLCDDPKIPWHCTTVNFCYSDLQRCNGINDCGDFSDETNCTSVGVTKHLIIYNKRSGQANLAWLVTPVVLGIGFLYVIYKCFNEGLCQLRRMRMQRAQEAQGSYFALDQVSFFAVGPLQRTVLSSPGHQLMVVHNHHFSLTMSDRQPPQYDSESPHTDFTPPPTYTEAMNPGISNAGFAAIPQEDPNLPPYKELPTPPPPLTPPPPSTPPPLSPPPAFTPRPRSRAASAPSRSTVTSPLHYAPVWPLSTGAPLSTAPLLSTTSPLSASTAPPLLTTSLLSTASHMHPTPVSPLSLHPLSTRSRHMSDSPSLSRAAVNGTVASPSGTPLLLPWGLPTSPRLPPSFAFPPPVSPLLPPPSPQREISVPSLQQFVNISANRLHTTDSEESHRTQ